MAGFLPCRNGTNGSTLGAGTLRFRIYRSNKYVEAGGASNPVVVKKEGVPRGVYVTFAFA